MRNRAKNCAKLIPIIHPVGISDSISCVSVVAVVSLFVGGFVGWCLFLVFVFAMAVVSLFAVGFFVFLNLSLGIVVGAPTPNGALKQDTRNHRQGPVEEGGLEI